MAELTKYSFAISIIAIALSIGVPVSEYTWGKVGTNDMHLFYMCNLDNEIAKCEGGLSNNSYSCYPFTFAKTGAIRCGNTTLKGQWLPIYNVGTDLGIKPTDILTEIEPDWLVSPDQRKGNNSWQCYTKKCYKIVWEE